MVEQYYVDEITRYSRSELQSVLRATQPPVCLLGGWAVNFHVNPAFRESRGQDYIGSRDIDLGIHVDPRSSPEELDQGPVGQTMRGIEGLGFVSHRFGFKKSVHRDSGETLTEDEAQEYGMHELFEIYIDVIPDRREPENFEAAFGFRPPAEPLLQPVFEDGAGKPLRDAVEWDVPDVLIADVPVLAAMKARSLPDREKTQKRVKDVADLHALLWYGGLELATAIQELRSYISQSDVDRLSEAADETVRSQAAALIGEDPATIQASLSRLGVD